MDEVVDARYDPPWADLSIVGVAGSSGSGKTSLAVEIINSLNLPWVVILSMDSFYNPLNPEQSAAAFRNEFDFDSPDAIDFDILIEVLKDLKKGKRARIPIYSFERHQREDRTSSLYSPHVIILEGIFALYDPRVLEMLDLKIFADADADLCLSRRSRLLYMNVWKLLTIKVLRDVKERGRDIEGCIKQWFGFVKPNFIRFVEPQRENADIIVPRGIENRVAIAMVTHHIQRTLTEKSKRHQEKLQSLGKQVEDEPVSSRAHVLEETPQIMAMNTIIQNPMTVDDEFVFYFDRLASLLIERALENLAFESREVSTPAGNIYQGLHISGEVSAVIILRGGSCFETGLKRIIPDCRTGRLLIKSNYRTGEPELHYQNLPANLHSHSRVLLLDPQMSSGGAALMAVRVLVDHGVPEERIVFVTYFAGKKGLNRLLKVYPKLVVVVCKIVDFNDKRWIEEKYFGC